MVTFVWVILVVVAFTSVLRILFLAIGHRYQPSRVAMALDAIFGSCIVVWASYLLTSEG